jgi:hypothetical protein
MRLVIINVQFCVAVWMINWYEGVERMACNFLSTIQNLGFYKYEGLNTLTGYFGFVNKVKIQVFNYSLLCFFGTLWVLV